MTLRVGVIGLGRAGRVHLDAWRAVGGVAVTALCDPSEPVRQWARSAGLPVFAEVEEMLARVPLDAVSICTPPATHAPVAIACLERGLDVLCEKPLATSARLALEMAQTAARAERHLLLATKFRHVPDLVAARDLIATGEIGEPIAFEIHFASMVDMTRRWNARQAQAGGGVIIDNGCHAFDLAAFLFGKITHVHATRLKPVQHLEVEDSATVLVTGEQGVTGRLELSWSLEVGRDCYALVHGSGGSNGIGWRGSWVRLVGRSPREIGPGYDKSVAHQRMMEAFVGVVKGDCPPWITSAESLRAVAAVEAAYTSMRTGAWAPVRLASEVGPRRLAAGA